jgi:hypothetical protein
MKTIKVTLEFSIPKESSTNTIITLLKQALRPVMADAILKSLGIKLDRKSSKIEKVEVEPW